jgi:hypothetical protein
LLAIPEGLEGNGARGGQNAAASLNVFRDVWRELGPVCGPIMILRLKLREFARFGKRVAERLGHDATRHGVLDVSERQCRWVRVSPRVAD